MTTHPPRIEKWRQWLKVINREIVVLHHNRRLYREIMQMIRRHPTLPKNSVVYDWIIRQYVVSATMGVRRQADTMTNVVSMARLLEQIECDAPLITRDWFVTEYGRLNNVADTVSTSLQLLEQVPWTAESFRPTVKVYAERLATFAVGLTST